MGLFEGAKHFSIDNNICDPFKQCLLLLNYLPLLLQKAFETLVRGTAVSDPVKFNPNFHIYPD
jgi:hypothetical protein